MFLVHGISFVNFFNITIFNHYFYSKKLRKGRFDGERTWAPNVIGDNDFVEDSIELDDRTTYRSCIRAENPQTEQSSNSFCITFVTGSIEEAPNKDESSRICIQREENWFQPLEQIAARVTR